ncbi:MAG: 16S rRNA (adenine(1518)-N(6)/adenine(1519)-N(6))-dimethyltransferase RsmA [Oscillospiraceae bacterium]|nr:16S rRNA (adenine(1518)-N(6)/adenine(1519)-N(6))-dimethyltransferase RsmA [Oscillospiraceae bacterium]
MEASLTNIRYVRSLLERHGFHFSKKLGQNFLINPEICPRIAEMGNAAIGHGILEIGTGIGTLTKELAKRAEKVTAVEVDQRLFPILEETVGQYSNLHIIHQDILKCDIPALLESEFGDLPVSVCANLPYYITAPILMHLLESHAKLETITVMVQKEVAEKLIAPVGTREAGAITVAVQYYGTVKQLFSVSRGSFLPPPNVDSAVIQIQLGTPYAEQVVDEKHFFRMVRSGFSQRRKTLVNALSATMGYEKNSILRALQICQLPETVRMESLTMEQLLLLHRVLLEQFS